MKGDRDMYMAVIEGYDNVMSFAEDKETAKRNAVEMIRKTTGTLIRDWHEAYEFYGAYILEIKDGLSTSEESIKCGWVDGVSYE